MMFGNSGIVLASPDGGRSFSIAIRPDRANLTAIVARSAGDAIFGLTGVIAPVAK